MPAKERDQPQVTLSDHDRWAQVELLLPDDTIRLYTRIGGLFTLLFAQPLARIARMRADQITTRDDGHVTVTFDTFPIELPAPLDRLVLAQLARRGQASYASRPDHWLFPAASPANTWPPRTSAASSSHAVSNPTAPAKPPCSSSPARSPPPSSPRSSAS